MPPPISKAAEFVAGARGEEREVRRLFVASLVPMVMLDNDRRYLEVNMAAQLLSRLPESELLGRRVDDLIAPGDRPVVQRAWKVLMQTGTASGRLAADLPDDGTLSIVFAAVANVLPGRHLAVLSPARWRERDLPAIPEGVRRETPLPLSPRQREVMRLVAAGHDVPQIAAELSLSDATVRTHVRDAMHRLRAKNRAHAVALAMASGLIA